MNWFFESPEKQAGLLAEIESWKGTGFRPKECKKGVASDCVRFVEAVLVNLGAITPVSWPEYVITRGGESMAALLLAELSCIREMELVWTPEAEVRFNITLSWMPGDVAIYSGGNSGHHLAIAARPPVAWHCIRGQGVCEGNLNDQIHRLIAVFRVKERDS